MKKASKDSANSFSQLKWKHASAEHSRLKESLKRFPDGPLAKRAKERIEILEKEYPSLRS